jgi:hypothetical protein
VRVEREDLLRSNPVALPALSLGGERLFAASTRCQSCASEDARHRQDLSGLPAERCLQRTQQLKICSVMTCFGAMLRIGQS